MYGYENKRNSLVYRYTRTAPPCHSLAQFICALVVNFGKSFLSNAFDNVEVGVDAPNIANMKESLVALSLWSQCIFTMPYPHFENRVKYE